MRGQSIQSTGCLVTPPVSFPIFPGKPTYRKMVKGTTITQAKSTLFPYRCTHSKKNFPFQFFPGERKIALISLRPTPGHRENLMSVSGLSLTLTIGGRCGRVDPSCTLENYLWRKSRKREKKTIWFWSAAAAASIQEATNVGFALYAHTYHQASLLSIVQRRTSISCFPHESAIGE